MVTLEEIQDYCIGKRIALVGNSGALLTGRQGEFIDSHDIVVRMNLGIPRRETSLHTGKRTDLWIFSLVNVAKQLAAFEAANPQFALRLKTGKAEAHPAIADRLYSHPPLSYADLRERLGSAPTTGCMAVDFFYQHTRPALVNLVGFDFFKTGSWLYSQDPRSKLHEWGHDSRKEEIYINSILGDAFHLVDAATTPTHPLFPDGKSSHQ